MKNRIVVGCLLGLTCAWLGTGCATPKAPLAAQQADWPKEKINAPALFAENCATCHGLDGRGHTSHGWMTGAQNFTDAEWQADTQSEGIINAIRTGPWVMPAFQGKLSETEIEALAAYVRTFRPTQ
jgi:cbb3-type cytochrome c oxidase subunit III